MIGEKSIVVLIYPIATNVVQGPPYSILFLERMLRDIDVDVVIFDQKHDKNIEKYIEENVSDIVLVGLSVMISHQIIEAKKIANFTKSISDIPILFGGWFPTTFPEIVLSEEFVDYIIIGQGENPFRELVLNLLEEKSEFNKIVGLGYKNERKTIINSIEPWANSFNHPPINLDLIRIEDYIQDGNMFTYIATIGCSCKCSFCTLSFVKDMKHFTDKPENVIDGLNHILKKHPEISHINFVDDNFFFNKNYVIRLANLIIERELNITWFGSAHLKYFLNSYNESEIDLIYKSGCRMIWCGAESADNEVLKELNKRYSKKDIIETLNRIKKHKISASFNFMVAFPPKPKKDFSKTLKLIMKLLCIDRSLEIAINFYLPFLENSFYFEAKKLGFAYPKSYDEFIQVLTNGFYMPWISKTMKRQVFYLGHFYIPIYKREYPLNTSENMKWVWRVFFFIFYPLVFIRFITRFYHFNFDAFLGMLLLRFFNKRRGVEVTDLNQFMHGFDRYKQDVK
jgi:anaerobic magnesium-protoporphyrin IX monomethyl ester cyclase